MLYRIKEKTSECLYWWLICLTAIVSYGYLIVTYTYGINDEVIDLYVYDTYLIRQDRIGIYIFNKIVHIFDLLPFWGEAIGVVTIVFASIVWALVLNYSIGEGKIPKIVLSLSACAFISFPYIGKSAIWRGCLAQAGIVLFFAGMAAYFYHQYLVKKKILYIVFSPICGMVALWFDKAYITTIIMGMLFVFWMHIRYEKHNFKSFLWEGVKLISCIVACLVLTILVVKLMQRGYGITANNYTSTYFRYNDDKIISQIIQFVPNLIKKILYLSKESWANGMFFVALIGTLLIGIVDSVKNKELWSLLISIGMIIDVLLIYIITGNLYMPERSVCHVIALFIAMFLVNIVRIIYDTYNRFIIARIFVLGIMTLCVINFTYEMSQIYYAKYLTFEKDKTILDCLMHDVYAKCGYNTQKPIVFLGIPNDMKISWPEAEKASVFSWGRLETIAREENSGLLYGFINDNGYSVKGVPQGIDFSEARRKISGMRNWPEDGCIEENDEYILVKLGDSIYEIFDMKKEELFQEYTVNDKINFSIDRISLENNIIDMSGWAVMIGDDAYDYNISVLLVSHISDTQYKLRINETIRTDVTAYFSDGYNYDNSGFNINMPLLEIVNQGSYDILLLIETTEGKYLVDIGQDIEVN